MAAYLRVILFAITCILVDFFLPSPSNWAESPQAVQPLQIINITPDGDDVPAGKKIIFQFDRAVVPVGAMDRKSSDIPISIDPEVRGRWRWLNTTTLAYILDEDSPLKPATRYEIMVNPGIRAESGATLSEPLRHSFITERPKVVHSWFRTWQSPSVPVIRVTFNQPVFRSSVENHLFVEILGQQEGRIRIKAEPDKEDKETPIFLPLPGENITLINIPGERTHEPPSDEPFFRKIFKSVVRFLARLSPGEADTDQEKKEKGTGEKEYGGEARRVWLVSPEKELPGDASVSLQVEPGLESALGPEKGVESRELVVFNTFPEFHFDGIMCFDNNNNRIFIEPGSAQDDRCLCNPLGTVMLAFSSPVINSEIKRNIRFDPPLLGAETEYDPWDDMRDYTRLNTPYPKERKYYIYLPRAFKADQVYHVTSEPGLRDEFGRTLKTPIDISFATDHRPPDFNLTNPMSILEKNVDTDMPVVVTNLDHLSLSFDRLTSKGKDPLLYRELPLPKVRDVAVKIPMQVRDMLEAESGVVMGSVESEPFVRKYGDSRLFFAEVTPFQVHVKMGHFNTLVWVTDLSTGKPVKGAKVCIYKDFQRFLPQSPEILTQGITDSEGVVRLAGSEELDPNMNYIHGYNRNRLMLFTKVEKDSDMALLPMDHNFLMSTYQASHNTVFSSKRRQYGHIRAWGTTAQGVYRAGDSIQYKIYVRNQDNEKFVSAPKGKYNLKVTDPMNKTVYEVKDIELSDFGALHGEFTVPKTGAVGWYRFLLSASFTQSVWQPMRVLVSDFTPSPFKVTTDINGNDFQPGDKIEITTQARLHGGGPYTDASARITVTLRKMNFSSDDPSARGFLFNSHMPETKDVQTLLQKDGSVDDKGNLVTSLHLSESDIYYGRLEVESAVRDDRGKYITGRTFADYASRDRFVGLRSDFWIFKEDNPATVDVIAVDAHGTPVEGMPISIRVEHRETTAARVKGAGNAYLTKLNTQWVEEEKQVIESGAEAVEFTFTPRKSGIYRVTALIKDSRGRDHSTQLSQWVAGKGMVLWEDDQKNGLDIVPEKKEHRVGETAGYLVKNPFPGAKALITIERYGILKHWVQILETATPVIEFEIEKDYIPGYYLSVVVMSPRMEKPPGDNDVDLGKPAFRMGYVEGSVPDPYKQITAEVKPEKKSYKPGDKVKVNMRASYRDNSLEEPVEFAVAVLDEAVLDLLSGGRNYFDPYKGFYKIDRLDMLNYSLLMQIVGRQKFEKKGADPAGDGGSDLGLRSVFKFVSYWNPSIKADPSGNADIEFEVPDNLTGWRVLAMAVTPGDRMGLGEGYFSVNRPTEIRPVMPNQVTEGDSFQSGFSVMNRTDSARELNITITAKNNPDSKSEAL